MIVFPAGTRPIRSRAMDFISLETFIFFRFTAIPAPLKSWMQQRAPSGKFHGTGGKAWHSRIGAS